MELVNDLAMLARKVFRESSCELVSLPKFSYSLSEECALIWRELD